MATILQKTLSYILLNEKILILKKLPLPEPLLHYIFCLYTVSLGHNESTTKFESLKLELILNQENVLSILHPIHLKSSKNLHWNPAPGFRMTCNG